VISNEEWNSYLESKERYIANIKKHDWPDSPFFANIKKLVEK